MSEVARRVRSQRRLWAAPGSHHDRVVRIAQILLPAGIAVLTGFLMLGPMFLGGDVSFLLDKNSVEVAAERLHIQSAQYRGEDAKGQPFRLRARSAVQKSWNEPVVQLNGLQAEIRLADGPAELRADRGRYNMRDEQVAVEGPVQFETADGYTLQTNDATVDLKTRRLASGGAVTGTTPLGTFSGDNMRADLEAHTVNLDGNARLRIVPKRANRQQ